MPGWANSDRARRLPADWQRRRATIRDRAGGRCQALDTYGNRCTARGRECDHVIAGDDHRLSNLQWLCSYHHQIKSSKEGAARIRRYSEKHPTERHPGLR